jgi:hypothetical protein
MVCCPDQPIGNRQSAIANSRQGCHKNGRRGVYVFRTETFARSAFFQPTLALKTQEVAMDNRFSKRMKAWLRPYLSQRRIGLLAVLGGMALLIACYPNAEVSYSNPQDPGAAQWLVEFRTGEEKVHMELRYQRKRERDGGYGYSSNGFMIAPEKLSGLTREQAMSSGTPVKFQLQRDAGTFYFEGWFKEGNGSGHFTFSPNPSFGAELNRMGLGSPNAEQQLSLALHDVGFALINELKAQGYEQPTLDQLVRMGQHGVQLEYVQGLKSMGYSVKYIDFLIKMRDHGVTVNFIRELTSLNYTGLTAEELIRTRDHGVTGKYINEFKAAGYNQPTLDDWITLRDHGVDMKFVRELDTLGYSRLAVDELRRMRDHGVDPSFIRELKEAGYDKISVEQLIRLRDHGVDAKFIRRMKERGHTNLSLDEYVRLRDRGEDYE